MEALIRFIERLLFFYLCISVIYLFIFSFFSLWERKQKHPVSNKKIKFLILIPAYKEDKVIMDSVNSALSQDYPADKLEVVVISDRMKDETNEKLLELPLTLFKISPDNSSKGYAMNYAIEQLKEKAYDMVVVLDADNVVGADFLLRLNDCHYSGAKAIQAHRVAKRIDSELAVLDAISEEINNSIFRKGHINIGLSSALIGSGMAIDYKWFKDNCSNLVTAGEDKELEILLLKEGIFIDYLEDVLVYDEKIDREDAFYNQRRRWLAAQFWSLYEGIKSLPKAILKNNIDYIDKIFQWMLPPRIILIGFIFIMTSITTLLRWELSVKWWVLFVALLFSFAMAVPDYMVTKQNSKAIKRLPVLFVLMVLNFFRLKGATTNFIHTKKG
ncbi:MAG: glycosyltransferase [Bacteroidales bacterium]|nr:glycosyltransferase [Bacteroidales bacterium]